MAQPISSAGSRAGCFLITAVTYAQFSNPADDVPAYHHPRRSKVIPAANSRCAQADRRKLPGILAG